MNQLTKLIEQCCEEKGLPSFIVNGLIKEVENEKGTWLNTLLEWLASRPTCGEEQRKFLDEVENKAEVDHCYYEPGDPHPGFFLIFDDCDFGKIDLQKVIKGASQ
jgi:hypothetical protein